MADSTDLPVPASPLSPGERLSARRLLPRFGLRSLLIFAIAFCLLFGWIGRNAYRMRREDAAIEALVQAGATINMQHERDQGDLSTISLDGTEPPPPPPSDFARMIGWSNRLPIRAVRLPGWSADEARLAAAIDSFGNLPEIERIVLIGSEFDDRAMPSLARVSGLKELVLEQTNVTGEGLASLAPHVRLLRLRISDLYQRQAPDVCSGVARFRDLERVELSTTEMGREDVDGLASLPRLEHLDLWGIRHRGGDGTRRSETEATFYAPLARAKLLKTLETGGIGMSDAEVGALADLPRLERLYIDGIGDSGLARLAALPKLKFLRVTSPVTREAARSYSAQHPECRVFYWVESDDPHARFRPGAVIDPNAERSEYYQAGEPIEN